MTQPSATSLLAPRTLLLWSLALVACGASNGAADLAGDLASAGDGGTVDLAKPPGEPTAAERTAAASSTAQNNALCTAIFPFYWEIGDVTGMLSSGSVGTSPPTATTHMSIASASKWVYGAYAV